MTVVSSDIFVSFNPGPSDVPIATGELGCYLSSDNEIAQLCDKHIGSCGHNFDLALSCYRSK